MNEVYKWDCYVISIGRKYFWARCKAIIPINEGTDDFDARFPIKRVTKRDRNVFSVGAIFTLNLGRKASIKFSHKRYTKAMIEESHRRADELMKGLHVK